MYNSRNKNNEMDLKMYSSDYLRIILPRVVTVNLCAYLVAYNSLIRKFGLEIEKKNCKSICVETHSSVPDVFSALVSFLLCC